MCNTFGLGVVWKIMNGFIVMCGDWHTLQMIMWLHEGTIVGCVGRIAMYSYSCVLQMTVSMEKLMEAASPRSGLNSTVRMKVTTQTTFR